MTSAYVFHLLTYPVKCNDRIIYRVTDYGEYSGDKGDIDLQPGNAEKRDDKESVIQQGYNCGDCHSVLETD